MSHVATRPLSEAASAWVEPALWFCLLLPLGIDPYGWGTRAMFQVSGHDVRIPYLATALCFAWFLLRAWREPAFRRTWSEALRPSALAAVLGALLLIGLVTALASVYPRRALFTWVWIVGTLAVLPAVLSALWLKHRELLIRSLLVYMAAMAFIILFDALVGTATRGEVHLGFIRVNLNGLVRPSAFKQEPGYWAAWALIMACGLRAAVPLLSGVWRKLAWGTWAALLLGAIASTSRMGVVAAVALLAFEWGLLTLRLMRRRPFRPVYALGIVIPALLFASALAYFATAAPKEWRRHMYTLLDYHKEPGMAIRNANAWLALKVFYAKPWFGAGPGVSAAEAVKRGITPDLLPGYTIKAYDMPLCNNLYTETLAEWGVVGTALLLGFFGLLFWPMGWPQRLRLAGALAVIYTSCETLPRFDLWLGIFFAWLVARERRRTGQPPPAGP